MKSKITKWNETATLQIELVVNNFVPDPRVVGKFYRDIEDISNNKPLSPELADLLDSALIREVLCGDERFDDEPADLYIEFRSEGYEDPGSTYDPETAYPPEGCDERTLIGVVFEFGDDPQKVRLTPEEQSAIFKYFEDEVQKYEID